MDAGSKKLPKPRIADQLNLLRLEVFGGVMGKKHRCRRQCGASSGRLLQFIKRNNTGLVGDYLGDRQLLRGAYLACDNERGLFVCNHHTCSDSFESLTGAERNLPRSST